MSSRGCIALLIFFLVSQGVFSLGPIFEDINDQTLSPLRKVLQDLPVPFWSLYLPTEANPGTVCHAALDQMTDDLKRDEITGSHRIIDSVGKVFTGFAVTYPIFVGSYDGCRAAASANSSFGGRYCNIGIKKINANTNEKTLKTLIVPPYAPKPVKENIHDVLVGADNQSVTWYSTCMPDLCTAVDLKESLETVLNGTHYAVEGVNCQLDLSTESFETADIIYIAALSVIGAVLLSASIVDIYIQKTGMKELSKGGLKWLLPFSAYTNLQKLFYMNTETAPGTINCLHGMRVLSMTWVVWGHQQFVPFVFTGNFNILWKKLDGILCQTELNAFPSVDSFFFMSGLLIGYNVMKEFKRSGKFNIPLFYFHRLLRLIPPMLLAAGLYATVANYFIDGPLSDTWKEYRHDCQKNWWMDVTFINNFAGRFKDPKADCLAQCWYLGVDTQFYVVAPLILLPILYKEEIGMLWLYLALVVSIIVPAAINYKMDLPPTSLLSDPSGLDFTNYNYNMPWCRAGPILIGMWLGIFLQKQGTEKVELQKWHVVSGWTVAALTGLMVVYGMWSYNRPDDKFQYDVMTQIIYGGLQRPAWGAALAWVVFACCNGYGGFVNDFLSHPVWQPFSRLAYSTYLVVLHMQYLVVVNTRIPYYYSQYNKVIETVGALIVAFIPSVLVSIISEAPIIGIEKLIFARPAGIRDVKLNETKESGINNGAFEETEHLKDTESSLGTDEHKL